MDNSVQDDGKLQRAASAAFRLLLPLLLWIDCILGDIIEGYIIYIYLGQEQEPKVDVRELEICNKNSIGIIYCNLFFVNIVCLSSATTRSNIYLVVMYCATLVWRQVI